MSMATVVAGPITFEEFERLPDDPENPGKRELLDGEVVQLPPADLVHMSIAEDLQYILRRHFETSGTPPNLGRVHIEMGYQLGDRSWFIPDVSIAHHDQAHGKYLEGAPALAVEVISESNRAEDIQQKVQIYLNGGSIEVWVIYPKTRSVMVHRPGIAREFTDTLTSELLPGWSIELSSLLA
jgi:Uma2 family endonuclease